MDRSPRILDFFVQQQIRDNRWNHHYFCHPSEESDQSSVPIRYRWIFSSFHVAMHSFPNDDFLRLETSWKTRLNKAWHEITYHANESMIWSIRYHLTCYYYHYHHFFWIWMFWLCLVFNVFFSMNINLFLFLLM